MHGKRRKRSPLHQDTSVIDTTKGDVDTTWVDKVYTKGKVDTELDKSGHYSEGSTRGKKKSEEHYTGKAIGGGNKKTFLGELDI